MNLKRKRKSTQSPLPKWLDPIIGPLDIDFVAPYPLETVIRILNQRSHRIYKDSACIKLTKTDASSYDFVLVKTDTAFRMVKAQGVLSQRSKNTAHIWARINAPIGIYLVNLALIALSILFAIFLMLILLNSKVEFGDCWPIVLFAMIFPIAYWAEFRNERRKLARTIEVSLRARRRQY